MGSTPTPVTGVWYWVSRERKRPEQSRKRDRSRASVVSCKHDFGVQLPAVPLVGVRTGTGYGWPGRFAKALALTGMWVQIPPPPPAGDKCRVESAECSALSPQYRTTVLWPSGSRRLPDTEEIGGSIPPRTTPGRVLALRVRCGMWCSGSTRPCEGRGEGFDSPRAALFRRSKF